MTISAVLFDLDGTLADTLDDITRSLNVALAGVGRPAVAPRDAAPCVGWGVRRLIENVVPDAGAELVDELVVRFRAHYTDHLVVETRPYPGIPELLDALVGRGLPLAILSNKPDAMTRRIAAQVFARWPFAMVLGQRDDLPRKPDPAGALLAAAAMQHPVEQIALVGDTDVDVATARAAGMLPVAVSWGFRPFDQVAEAGAAAILTRPAELLELIG
ncbi:MAG TPA: HAD hydrolase-like protein [Kofleriaceae bacterium]|jgi:phosphoglycolate phosphatase|nr:HAD hydrolase-like protein [Kofleriaceae bacterium]